MHRKRLEIALERVPPHRYPSAELEQYTLPAPLAAELLWRAYMDGAVRDRRVVDLGCGTGRLTIGSALLGASLAVGVDIDGRALEEARRAAERLGVLGSVDFIRAQVPRLALRADTVVQNPPFGVRRRGADVEFLRAALGAADRVYSLHKSTKAARRLLSSMAAALGKEALLLGTYLLRLPPSLDFHRKRFHSFYVDLYAFRGPIS